MTATYDTHLSTDRDWVRRLIGDTDTAKAVLADEEIDAILAEETATGKALKYFAAASALGALLARWSAKGAWTGLASKTVGQLSKTWGVPGTSAQTMTARIRELRMLGASACSTEPSVFKVL